MKNAKTANDCKIESIIRCIDAHLGLVADRLEACRNAGRVIRSSELIDSHQIAEGIREAGRVLGLSQEEMDAI